MRHKAGIKPEVSVSEDPFLSKEERMVVIWRLRGREYVQCTHWAVALFAAKQGAVQLWKNKDKSGTVSWVSG